MRCVFGCCCLFVVGPAMATQNSPFYYHCSPCVDKYRMISTCFGILLGWSLGAVILNDFCLAFSVTRLGTQNLTAGSKGSIINLHTKSLHLLVALSLSCCSLDDAQSIRRNGTTSRHYGNYIFVVVNQNVEQGIALAHVSQ